MICGTISSSNASLMPKTAVSIIKNGISYESLRSLISLLNMKLVMAVLGLHAGGFLLGYVISKLVGAGESRSRAISIETGLIYLLHMTYYITFSFIYLFLRNAK